MGQERLGASLMRRRRRFLNGRLHAGHSFRTSDVDGTKRRPARASHDGMLQIGKRAFIHETISSLLPISSARSRSARPLLTAISASPFEFSYQKAAPDGRSLKVLSRCNTRPDAARLAPGGSVATLSPVTALPK